MQSPLSPVTHFLPITVIRRVRLLPQPGKLVVRKGQRVKTTDVVAETSLNPEHLLLDVGRGLGLSAAKADAQIQRQAGEKVSEGDILAGPVGFPKRVVRAPRDGEVMIAGSGQILLETEGRLFEMRAGMPGMVMELIPDRGVELEAGGALIQGVWGNGRAESPRVDDGLTSILIRTPQDTLTPDMLDVSQRGAVVVGGYCADRTVFSIGAELPIRGLLLASMESALIPDALKAPYPIVVLEGFGKIPMNAAAFKLLTTSDRREASLNAEPWDKIEDTRPELVISLPSTPDVLPPNEVGELAPGKMVRLTAAPYKGVVGSVVVIRPGLATLASGVRAPAADIRLDSGETILAPLANLEILE